MLTTPGPCGCSIGGEYGTKRYIIYCPTHAAAPDLLAALEAFVRAVEGSDGWEHYPPQALVLADARAAISEVEGEK